MYDIKYIEVSGDIITGPQQMSEEFKRSFTHEPNILTLISQIFGTGRLPPRIPAFIFFDPTNEHEIIEFICIWYFFLVLFVIVAK